MTRRTARHSARSKAPRNGLYTWRLLAVLAAAGITYCWALTPVLASLRTDAAQEAARARLAQRVAQTAANNKALAARLQNIEQSLSKDTKEETSLQDELVALKQQKPPAASQPQAFSTVPVPNVQTTTGASGHP